jgi:2-iminobutanoate/2-iminopropanoate deaminase
MKEIVTTVDAPQPIGPYSQAVRVGSMLFVSGQVAIDPATGKVVQGGAAAQAEQVMKNLDAVLKAAGFTFADVAKTSIFLTNMSFFAEVNQVYGKHFISNFPARETVAVAGLPLGVDVEISVIAIHAE